MRKVLNFICSFTLTCSVLFLGYGYMEYKDVLHRYTKSIHEKEFLKVTGQKELSKNFDLESLTIMTKTPYKFRGDKWEISPTDSEVEVVEVMYKFTDLAQALVSIENSSLLLEKVEIDEPTSSIKLRVRVRGSLF